MSEFMNKIFGAKKSTASQQMNLAAKQGIIAQVLPLLINELKEHLSNGGAESMMQNWQRSRAAKADKGSKPDGFFNRPRSAKTSPVLLSALPLLFSAGKKTWPVLAVLAYMAMRKKR